MASTKNTDQQPPKLFWRIFISLVGVAMIWIAVSGVALYFFGELTIANVSTRRMGGAQDGLTPDRQYEWSLDYTFRDKQGVSHSGHTKRRGGPMSVQIDRRVYYFPAAPFINALESEARANLGQVLLVGIGVFLIVVMNKKGKKPPALVRSPDSKEA